MRRFFFPGYHADLDLPEARILEPAMQIALCKAEPAVAIGISRLLKAVLQQIQNQDLAPGAQQSMRLRLRRRTDPPHDARPGSK